MHPHLITETVVTASDGSSAIVVNNNVPKPVSAVRGAAAKPRVNLIITNASQLGTPATYFFKLSNDTDCTSTNWDFYLSPGERIVFDNWRGKVTVYPTPPANAVQCSEGF